MAKKFKNLKDKVLEEPGARERIDGIKGIMDVELTLAELRKARELTQTELATALEIKQSGVSRIEGQTDLYLSTLGGYVNALGGELELRAKFDGESVIVNLKDVIAADKRELA